MNTAWLEVSPADPLADDTSTGTSTAWADCTRIRANPPPDVQAAADDVTKFPIARLMLSQPGRAPTTSRLSPDVNLARDLPIVVLTTDTTFAKQLQAAIDGAGAIQVIATEDAAAELAVAGRCGILITDIEMPRSTINALAARLRAHDPSTAIIVVGNRDQGGAFIGLQSSGVVNGFLLKPVTAAATQLVLEAATRRHGTAAAKTADRTRHRTRSQPTTAVVKADLADAKTIESVRLPAKVAFDIEPATTAAGSTSPSALLRPIGYWTAAIVIVAAGIAWWLATQRVQGIDVPAIAAKHLALADDAYAAGQLVEPHDGAVHHYQRVLEVDPQNLAAHRGLDRVAAELSRNTQHHMSKQDLPEAALSIQRLRELRPDYPELPLLETQLRVLQNAVVASHASAAVPLDSSATAKSQREAVPPQQTRPQTGRPQTAHIQDSANAGDTPLAPAQDVQSNPAATRTAALIPTSSAANNYSNTIAAPAPTPIIDSTLDHTINLGTQAITNDAPQSIKLASAPNAPLLPTQKMIEPASSQNISETAPLVSGGTNDVNAAAPETVGSLQLVKYVPPNYPSEAFARGMEGWIQVGMEITPSGDVINARIEQGEKRQLFGRAALIAVRQWKYAPNAQRTSSEPLSVRLEFKLK